MKHRRKPKTPNVQEQCERAAKLRVRGLSYAEIGAVMHVSAIAARDMARRHERDCERKRLSQGPMTLPPRAILNLVVGTYGPRFGAEPNDRLPRLADIAAAYTWNELLAEEGIGRKTAWLIRLWLESQGRQLRSQRIELPLPAGWPATGAMQKRTPASVPRPERRHALRFVAHRGNGYMPAWHQRRWA